MGFASCEGAKEAGDFFGAQAGAEVCYGEGEGSGEGCQSKEDSFILGVGGVLTCVIDEVEDHALDDCRICGEGAGKGGVLCDDQVHAGLLAASGERAAQEGDKVGG